MKSAICRGSEIGSPGKSTISWQHKSKCVAKFGFYPYFRVNFSIKNDTVNDTIVSFTVSVMVAEAGLEPTTSGL